MKREHYISLLTALVVAIGISTVILMKYYNTDRDTNDTDINSTGSEVSGENNKDNINSDTNNDSETDIDTNDKNNSEDEDVTLNEDNKKDPYEGFTKEEIDMIQDATTGDTEYSVIVDDTIVPDPDSSWN